MLLQVTLLDKFEYGQFQGSTILGGVACVIVVVAKQFWIALLWACLHRQRWFPKGAILRGLTVVRDGGDERGKFGLTI